MIASLQYISQGKTIEEHLSNIEAVCAAGGDWVQLRLKKVDEPTYLAAAKKARLITEKYGARLIINDNIQVALASRADGVHLGLSDESTAAARQKVGADFIVGGTANKVDDVLLHVRNGVDYVGVGPFRFTETKQNLSAVLGLEGYGKLLEELADKNIDIPVVAIGGISTDDFRSLKEKGINKIAVSGLLSNNGQEEIIQEFKNTFNHE
jgi:thiamine-phosphate pyrophosphorylase